MDVGAIVAVAGLAVGMVGSLLVYMVRIENRMTRLETTINERLPARAAA